MTFRIILIVLLNCMLTMLWYTDLSETMMILHNDLNKLEVWSNKWQMLFNPSKCEHLQVTLKKQPLVSSYKLYNHSLQKVTHINYLGVTVNNKLNWSDHVTKIANKVNRTRTFLQRNLKQCPRSVKIMCYKSYVCPILEYSSTVWAPYTYSDKYKLEMALQDLLIITSHVILAFHKCL